MSSKELIDQQFDRAVEIVQGLPQTGPIQTQYDEKLTMYGLYKQATVGNVEGPRPGMWDMLGRAKWDAWAKNEDLDTLEAKWLYVDALLRVLRKYSDKTMARSLVEELESFGGDPRNLVMSRSFSKSRHSGSSVSTESGERTNRSIPKPTISQPVDNDTSEEEDTDEEEDQVPQGLTSPSHRPPSSLSSNRYRTPMAGSLAMSPPLPSVPAAQPLPTFDTPSAFADYAPPPPSSYQAPSPSSFAGQYSSEYQAGSHDTFQNPLSRTSFGTGIRRPASRMTLEHAVENVQVHLAALTERMDSLQSSMSYSPSRIAHNGSRSLRASGEGPNGPIYDLDDLGLWSYVVQPAARGIDLLKEAALFFARNENRTPTMIIVRRLCLDVSFLFCVITIIRIIWRKSGMRRREVKAALGMLWKALVGSRQRHLVDRGV